MFHSAALKLTLWYLAIIMAISLIFSGLLYRVSSIELDRNVNRQIGYFSNFLGPHDSDNYNRLRQNQLNEDRDRLRANLFVFNLLVLAAGGAASYWLARRTLEPIEQALDAQSRFTADASHELRTPLTAIQTENEVALRDPGLSKAQAKSLLKSNLEEIAKLKALAEGLLHLASGQGQVYDFKKLELGDAIKAAVEPMSATAAKKNISVKTDLKPVTLNGDFTSLSELFSIFLDNAIKYSPPNTAINIASQTHGKEVLVKITDQGQGITPQEMPHIFERFYRNDASRTKNEAGGYGLGLAIAKQIAQNHGGHIEVTSTPNKGSTFTIQLPGA